jgi:Protein of unknown function (DUF2971)
MTKVTGKPRRLYKYRTFSSLTLDMLVADVIYFADPSSFNDPLDTKPSLNTDVGADVLESILKRLFEQRISAEMAVAAKSIRYSGPKTLEHIERLTHKETEKLLADIRYSATDPNYEVANPAQYLLGQYVEKELLRRYDRGVFSLAERANCPLMWSHYGDQHRGLCLGYSVPATAADNLHKIKYGGSRLVDASAVAAMLDGDVAARRKVDEAVLLRKAADWRYEKEWRLLGPRGSQDAPLELEEVIFGMRCTEPVKYAVTEALANRGRPVRFGEIQVQSGRFLLAKRALDTDELSAFYPRRGRAIEETFADSPVLA